MAIEKNNKKASNNLYVYYKDIEKNYEEMNKYLFIVNMNS